MRTGRSLTVCWGWGCLLRGVSAPGGCLLQGGYLLGGGVCSWVVVVFQHALRQTPPPVNRMTDRCKNITLATTSLVFLWWKQKCREFSAKKKILIIKILTFLLHSAKHDANVDVDAKCDQTFTSQTRCSLVNLFPWSWCNKQSPDASSVKMNEDLLKPTH